jgi:hypothetical protein
LFFQKKPYPIGVLADFSRFNNTKIGYMFLDCNGDDLYDYTHDYQEANITVQTTIDECMNLKGSIKHSVGVILQKIDVNASWEMQECKALARGTTNCLVKKSYEVIVI